MNLQISLVLVLLSAKLAVNCKSGHMLANDVPDQITHLCRSLSTTGTRKSMMAVIQHQGSYRFIMLGEEIYVLVTACPNLHHGTLILLLLPTASIVIAIITKALLNLGHGLLVWWMVLGSGMVGW